MVGKEVAGGERNLGKGPMLVACVDRLLAYFRGYKVRIFDFLSPSFLPPSYRPAPNSAPTP